MFNGRRVLVAGASGYIGGYVAGEFKSRGWTVRALARSAAKLGGTGDLADETAMGEVTDPASIAGVCDGVEVVFSSIGITHQKDGLGFMDVDFQGNLNLLREAQGAGVGKFIYVSVFKAEQMADLAVVKAKLRFERELKASGLDYAVIRPNGFFSDMLDYLRMAQKGRGYVFGDGEKRINPIHGHDLAVVCVDAVDSDQRRVEVGGPEVFTHREIFEMAFAASGRPARISRVPMWLGRGLMAVMRLATPARVYGPLEFFVTVLSRDLIAPGFGAQRLGDFFRQWVQAERNGAAR